MFVFSCIGMKHTGGHITLRQLLHLVGLHEQGAIRSLVPQLRQRQFDFALKGQQAKFRLFDL